VIRKGPVQHLVRAISVVVGVALVLACLLVAVVALSALLVVIGQTSSSASLVSQQDTLLSLVGGLFTVILIGIAIRYAYYYQCWYASRHWFAKPPRIDVEMLQSRDLPYLKFQVTTKGGALPVVERSLRVLEAVVENNLWLKDKVCAEIITERENEVIHLGGAFAGSALDVTPILLPPDYSTPNGTRLKARALHHLVERRLQGFNAKPGKTFIVHLDEETVVTEPHVMVLLEYLSNDPRPLSQGPILYPLEWTQTPWLCRAIESTRPFGCAECARVMQNPPPPHLHGSNLVVEESVENHIGWDFGTLEGQPFVAEDLLFGLRAYAMLGEETFGWHGATMLEQPPLSLFWAIQQRLRWVLGALQGLRAMWVQSDYAGMPKAKKVRLSLSVYARIATYSLGFPIGLTGLIFALTLRDLPRPGSSMFLLRVALLLSALGWFASYQIGLRRNLMYQSVPWYEQVKQHGSMLVMTPIVGLCETVGPFVALIRWMLGARRAQWTPTPKLSDRPEPLPDQPATAMGVPGAAPAEAPAETPALEPPMQQAPIPGWLMATMHPRRALLPRGPLHRGPMLKAGRALIAFGLLVGLFTAYEFLATGVFYKQSQRSLLAGFKQEVPTGRLSAVNTASQEGSPIALLELPRIGVDGVVVEGSSPETLKDGPGHLRGSPMPGEFGNSVIVGHRTTYGGPFHDLDRVVRGDSITVTTGNGSFVYKVTDVMRTGAGQSDPLNGSLDSRLTLVTSTPAYVPDGRLAVVAKLQGDPGGVPDRPRVPVSSSELGLAGDPYGLGLALFWGVLLAAAVGATWRWARTWPARVRHLLATPLMLVLVVLIFAALDRMLPGTM
jgi:LPXTG-site transpeptidase (sortase) family protein